MTTTVPYLVSIIAPCRNERAHIDAFCTDALAQQLPAPWQMELCIADGQSDDGTRERLQALAAQDARIRWIDNPGRIVSAGLNRALDVARGEVIVRMDIHTSYDEDYVAQCLAALQQTNADNVGGPWVAEPAPGADATAHAVAASFQSPWVAGGAASRRTDFSGWVDTVYLGCWRRATFDRYGGFDETLVRNQDDEHNLRLRRRGARIWQSAAIHSRYRPRGSLRQVFSQWFQYGYWKPFVIVKHRQPASLRHLVPALFVAGLVLTLLLMLLGGPAWPLRLLGGAYAAAVLGLTVLVVRDQGVELDVAWRVPAVIACYHIGYGLGSWPGWWDALRQRPGRAGFSRLTR